MIDLGFRVFRLVFVVRVRYRREVGWRVLVCFFFDKVGKVCVW